MDYMRAFGLPRQMGTYIILGQEIGTVLLAASPIISGAQNASAVH